MNETTTTKKRGGPQPGSGRPPKHPNDRVIKCNISMTKAHHEATGGDRAGMIRRALDWYLTFWENEITINQPPGANESKIRNSTRLKDENGIEIFEGDILECQNEGVRDVMTWSEDWQYHLKINLNHNQEQMSDWVVVGNIQDNPEVLI